MHTRTRLAACALLALVGCRDDAESPTEPPLTSPSPQAVAATASTLAFSQVTGGGYHTCGVTTDSLAYCWGYNQSGQLGTGPELGPGNCMGAIGPFPCSTRPVAVIGGHRFRQVTAGEFHTCGATGDYRAWCWGGNNGALGDGTSSDRVKPVPVAGGHRFRQVDAGYGHTCGVSYPNNKAYCWGVNAFGQLGDGTLSTRLAPVEVLGGHQFRQVSAGDGHTCGITTANEAFCWGWNKYGQIGDSTNAVRRVRPVQVAGPGGYRQITAGSYHTCAVTTGDRAYCWGRGTSGQIGNGKAYLSFWPRAVAGGLAFTRVSAGLFFSCGETATGQAYCWGSNSLGELGDGTGSDQLKPVAVAGGLSIRQLSAGDWHACAKSSTGAAYCWGYGFFGALGDGTSGYDAGALAPVPVLGPQ